ncbi:MAG: hypothetical protein AB8F78_18270 [Saprospiraceae bacterium]
MSVKILSTLLFSLTIAFTYAQNKNPNRDNFTLVLPVDGKSSYEQDVVSGPYFPKEKVLQIYPGETLLIEVETKRKKIISMKVVTENLSPKKTIEIEFTQTVKDRKNEFMMLKVLNPFKKDLEYKAMMFIVGRDNWMSTSIIPIKREATGFEMWNDVLVSLVLTDWELK